MLPLLLLALPDLPDEDRLLAQARRGDRKAIARIYDSFFEPVYRFIRWRVDDPAVAEDLTSEVFLKFLAALRGEHAPRDSLRGWLFRVARNVLHDHYRGTLPINELDDSLPLITDGDMESDLQARLDAERVRRALAMLAPDQQEVLILRFGQMMSLQDTAESMGKSISAIKSLQFRAVDTLRRLLAESEPEATHGLI
ncbi:MAG: sigma-70 family RNA polymerase sigma factor [Anaerolineae bacterium]